MNIKVYAPNDKERDAFDNKFLICYEEGDMYFHYVFTFAQVLDLITSLKNAVERFGHR